MPTFVHTADLHLDTPFTARFTRKEAVMRRKEMMQTFRMICENAKECDLFLIAGDLFDSRYVSAETVSFLKHCFSQIPDTHVFLAAGNHDPLTEDSCYMSEETWGEHVHIFGTETEYIDIPELRTRVHGRSFSRQHEETTLLTPLSIKEDWCNLLLIHGEVVSDYGKSRYNPLEKSKLEASGVDYAALGHVHQASELIRMGTTYYAYPGIPEGRGFDETGTKGYLRGSIEKGLVQASWIPISKREFIWETLEISVCNNRIEVVELIKDFLQKRGSQHCYRLVLRGKISFSLPTEDILSEEFNEDCFLLELRDETQPAYHLLELAEENTLRGAFVKEMLRKIDAMKEEEKAFGNLALKLGLEVMEGGKAL